jgi:type II secretory pathway predicted ATPase ExeA
MSYLRHWKLSRSPFAKPHPIYDYFVAGSVEEALARSEFLLNHRRKLGLLVGPSGAGKSLFLEHLRLRRLTKSPESIAKVDLVGASPLAVATRVRNAVLETSSDECGLGSRGLALFSEGFTSQLPACFSRVLGEIDDFLVASSVIGRRVTLLLDHAEQLSEESLKALGVLLTRPGKWSLILAVDEESMVGLPRRILDCCELRIDLPPWDLGQTADYFEFALDRCGASQDLFTAQGITRCHELGDGLIRRIAQLADLALVAGAVRGLERVDADLVDQVFDEFSITLGAKFQLM